MAEQTIGIYRVRNVAHMQSKKLEFESAFEFPCSDITRPIFKLPLKSEMIYKIHAAIEKIQSY